MGLDKLIDFIIAQLQHLIPIYFVYEYQLGIRFWCGKFQKVISPGIWFKIPYFNTMMRENTVDTTMLLLSQSVITKDGIELVVQGSVGYKIVDIKKFFLQVYDVKSAIRDKSMVIIRDIVAESQFDFVRDIDLSELLQTLVQKEVDDYGIGINFVSLVSITQSSSVRLMNETINVEV